MSDNEGIVIESVREHYEFQATFALLPDLASSAITDSLIDERYFPILPLSLGLTVGEDTNGATVTPLLTTSDASYSKLAGYELDTYDKEEGDLDGPFTLAVSVEAARWCGSPPPPSWTTSITPFRRGPT